MNTEILMKASSIFYGFMGIGFTFLPEEIAQYIKADVSGNSLFIYQLLGAVYVGFAMLNWMAKNNLIGGIYSRPLVVGNLTHFLVSSLALIKIAFRSDNSPGYILVLAVMYSAFTLLFGYVFMTNPSKVFNNK